VNSGGRIFDATPEPSQPIPVPIFVAGILNR
jgi:hypothetical protein